MTARLQRFTLAVLLLVACADRGKGAEVSRTEPIDHAGAPASMGSLASSGAQSTPESRAPTWYEHIAPIVVARCATCHQPGGIAPVALHTYAAAAPLAKLMADAVERGAMPPFLAQATDACTPRYKYADDPHLTDAEKALLRAWADTGAPAGDPSQASTLPAPAPRELPRADSVLVLPAPIVVEARPHLDIHTCVIVDPQLTNDVYVIGRQITPGNPRILHHVLAYTIKPERSSGSGRITRAELVETLQATKHIGIGDRYDCFGGPGLNDSGLAYETLASRAPGAAPAISPYGSGQPLARDALVVLDLHFHPSAKREEDGDTKLSLMFAQQRPALVSQPVLIGNFTETVDLPSGTGALIQQPEEPVAEFRIPAGAQHHVEEMTWTWKLPSAPYGIRVAYAATHMHYVGRDMQVILENTDPQLGESNEECLVQTPRWDFNWQRGYGYQAAYDQLPLMNPGDILRLRCTYDNSPSNPFLAAALAEQGRDEPVDVTLGEDTLDEMCLASIGIIYPNPFP